MIYIEEGADLTVMDSIGKGKITGSAASAVVVNGGTFTLMTGGIIAGNTADELGGGVRINSGAFVLNGGTITENSVTGGKGGGVALIDGTFEMKSGTISKNTANEGGGVAVSGGTVTLTGGTIEENSADNGAGMGVYAFERFDMLGGTFKGNVATGKGGGLLLDNCGTFGMNGGQVDMNEAAQGGGIYADHVQFTIVKNGVQIKNNSATLGGGVAIDGGAFTMQNGDINKNNAISGNGTGKGGGLYVNAAPVYLMEGAAVRNNTAEYGGGVFMTDMGDNRLIMGTNVIKQNRATLGGGGLGLSNTVIELPLVKIIEENYVGQSDTDKQPQNYWLENGATMNVVQQLDKADRVYVWADIPEDDLRIIATGVKLDRDNFVCDDGDHTASRDIDGNMVLGKKLAVHFAPGEGVSGTMADDYAVLNAAYTMPRARQYTPPVGKLIKGWMITGGYKDTKAKAVGANLVITDEMLVDGDLYLEAVWGDGVDYVDEYRTNRTAADVTNLSDLDSDGGADEYIVLGAGWYLADGVTFEKRVKIDGEVNLIIDNNFDTTMSSGIQLQEGTTLHIWGQGGWETAVNGKLAAIGGDDQAGIGGSGTTASGTFVLHSGNVEAIGGNNAAGIGGGQLGRNSIATIHGGKLKAHGGLGGAGIGGGDYKGSKGFYMQDGFVHAEGGKYGAGIGGGRGNYSDAERYGFAEGDFGFKIVGGHVEAYGGDYAAGIGSGQSQYQGKPIIIEGGYVYAKGGHNGAGIGAGEQSSGTPTKRGGGFGNIRISGGTVRAYGGKNGAGIGGGDNAHNETVAGNVAKIEISGGDVHAEATGGGAGIGAGEWSYGGTISITGGKVYAEAKGGGAGIGGGANQYLMWLDGPHALRKTGYVDTIEIKGGEIEARSSYGAAIGNGYAALWDGDSAKPVTQFRNDMKVTTWVDPVYDIWGDLEEEGYWDKGTDLKKALERRIAYARVCDEHTWVLVGYGNIREKTHDTTWKCDRCGKTVTEERVHVRYLSNEYKSVDEYKHERAVRCFCGKLIEWGYSYFHSYPDDTSTKCELCGADNRPNFTVTINNVGLPRNPGVPLTEVFTVPYLAKFDLNQTTANFQDGYKLYAWVEDMTKVEHNIHSNFSITALRNMSLRPKAMIIKNYDLCGGFWAAGVTGFGYGEEPIGAYLYTPTANQVKPPLTLPRRDYVLCGWRVGSSDSLVKPGGIYRLNEPTTIYAVWGYDMTYESAYVDSKGETHTMQKVTQVPEGSIFILPEFTFAAPKNPKLDFYGWKREGKNEVLQPGDGILADKPLKIQAIWSAKVTFSPGKEGAGEMRPAFVTPGTTYTLPDCGFTQSADGKYDGKSFAGWRINGHKGYEYGTDEEDADLLPPGTRITLDNSITAEAVFAHLLRYDAAGGSGTMPSTPYLLGQTYTLAECAFTPPGNTKFAGWVRLYDNGKENIKTLQPGDQYGMYDNMQYDHVYRAVWMATIHFDRNGSYDRMADVKVRYDTDYVLPKCSMRAPAGLNFVGWEVNGEVYQAGSTIHIMDSMTIKALWDRTYVIELHAKDGFGTMDGVSGIYEDGLKYTLPENGFTGRNGSVFMGWRIFGDTEVMQPGTEIDITGSMTIQAVWGLRFVIEAYGETILDTMVTRGEPFTLPTYPCPDGRDLIATFEFSGEDRDGWVYKSGDTVTIYKPMKMEAAWKALVTFDANGGSGYMDSVLVEPDSKYKLPNCRFHTPSYWFVGWQADDEPDYHKPGDDGYITIANNTTLKAVWGRQIIFLDALGGGDMEPMYVKAGDSCELPENGYEPRENTEFVGWHIGNAHGEVKQPGETITPVSDTAVYAAWNVTLTFDGNGGEGTMDPVQVLAYSEYTLPDNPYTAPGDVRFIGWQEGTDRDTIHEAGSTIKVLYPDTIWAVWSTVVTFDPNGGSGAMSPIYVAAGRQATLPECEFAPPEGTRFRGWELDGRILQPGDKVPGDVTVKAYWVQLVTVSFDADGGGEFDDQVFFENSKATKPAKEPEKDGYKFIGWYLGDEAEPFDFNTAITENTTLTARYAEAAVVSFDPGPYGKGSMNSVIVERNGSYTLPGYGSLSCVISNTGLAGWRVGDSTEILKRGDTITVTQDVTLTAMWYMSVHCYDDFTGDTKSADVLVGAEFTLPDLPDQPDGRVLQGWRGGKGNLFGAPGQAITIDRDYGTLNAVWAFPVIFDAGDAIGEPITVYAAAGDMRLPECPFTEANEDWIFTGWVPEGDTFEKKAGVLVYVGAPATYYAQWNCMHDGEEFKPWTLTNSLPSSGNYYLRKDVDMRGRIWYAGDVKLCLRGKKVSNFAKGYGILPSYRMTVEIFDHGDGTGELGCQTEYNGSRIDLRNGAKFILHDGTVSLGIQVDGKDDEFRMDGGTLTADGDLVNNGKVTITGGTLLREITGTGTTDRAAKLTFRSGIGTGDPFEMDVEIGQTIAVPDNTNNFQPPQNTGRSFLGWREVGNGAVWLPGEEMLIRGSAVLDAVWISAILEFDANGGTGEMAEMYVEDHNDLIMPECGFTAPARMAFAGWQIGDDAQTIYQPGDMPEQMGRLTLKAVWKEATTVSFDPDGGSGEMPDVTMPVNGSFTLPDCGFAAPEGHAFEGWLVGEEDEKLYQPGEVITITGSLTIYAAWRATIPTFRTHSLLLNGEIGVNFFMELPEIEGVDYADSYMEFTVKSKNGKTTRASFDAEFGDVSGNGYYGFTVNVNSIQMAAPIHAVFHYGDGQTVEQTYSVKDYIVAYEAVKDNYDPRMTALIHALADYGHYAQITLSSYNGWTIGTDYAEMDVYYTENLDVEGPRSAVSGFGMKSNLGDSEVSEFTYKLNLLSQTEMRVFVAFKDGYTGSAACTLDGKTVKSELQPNGHRMVSIPNIPAQRLDEWHTLTVTTDSGTATVRVSPMTYIRWLLNDANKMYRETGAALYYYNETCEAYRAEYYGEED